MPASRRFGYEVPERWPESLDCSIPFNRLHRFERMKRGGFAMVYRAQLEGRNVAVKVLRSDEQGPSMLFIQEAAILRMLNHRGVVDFLGVCTIPKGCEDIPETEHKPRLAIVEEYLEGGSLKNVMIRQSLMGWNHCSMVLDLLIDVAETVKYLHGFQPRVLHRDLTPDNILITKKNGRMRAKLIDFGLVALVGKNGERLSKLGFDSLSGCEISITSPDFQQSNLCSSGWDPISVSSVDTWRICEDYRAPIKAVEGTRPLLCRNYYKEEDNPVDSGPVSCHGEQLIAKEESRQVTWWTDAKTRFSNILGPRRRISEMGHDSETAALKAGSSDNEESPHSRGTGLRQNGVGLASKTHEQRSFAGHQRSSLDRDSLNPVALTGQTGSFMYMAPEIFQRKPYCETADVFSFGTILYEAFSGKLLLITHTDMASARATIMYAHRVALGYRPTMPKRFPTELSRLIMACWDPDPLERPLFPEVLSVLQEMQWEGTVKTMTKKKLQFFHKLCGSRKIRGRDDSRGRSHFC